MGGQLRRPFALGQPQAIGLPLNTPLRRSRECMALTVGDRSGAVLLNGAAVHNRSLNSQQVKAMLQAIS